MKLFVELFVTDLARSRRFYVDALGMKVVRDEPDYVELRSGDAQINLCPVDSLREGHYLATKGYPLGTRVEICLQVEDLEATYRRALAAGVGIYEPITRQSWKQADFRVLDPDGAYIRITTPVR